MNRPALSLASFRVSALFSVVTAAMMALTPACGGDDDDSSANNAATGGPVKGATDNHCVDTQGKDIIQSVDFSVCPSTKHRAISPRHGDEEHYGTTLYNDSGSDDECKFDVSISAENVRIDSDSTISLSLTTRETNKAATGAKPYIEAFLDDTHPLPGATPTGEETSDGEYKFSNVKFDASGRWTVRFHFYGDCETTAMASTEPHSHVAFYMDVP